MQNLTLAQAAQFILAKQQTINLATPLGLGKPHRLLNEIYEAVKNSPQHQLNIYTALSLNVPTGSSDLEKRFVAPFAQRFFGEDFVRLQYVQDRKKNNLPANVHVEEFYMQSGALLASQTAQSNYASLNYTYVAPALADRQVNVLVQKVALGDDGRLSLSCNTDLSLDVLDAVVAKGLPRPLFIAEIDPNLPYIGGEAALPADFFDVVIEPPAPHGKLFALPRQPVGDVDYAIGFFASTLVKDGGTLQIGIGALADALAYALVLRHTNNALYRQILTSLDPNIENNPTVNSQGGLEPFTLGLYGCSEMLNEGFRLLVQTGVIKRKVVEDEAIMQRIYAGTATQADKTHVAEHGQYLHGAFYLGSPEFYNWLRQMPANELKAIGMQRISQINHLYGGYFKLEQYQRPHARFFNTCMMATALGGAMSETLDDGRVVSGVGGQYNFVSMAHALPQGRSILMLRSHRDSAGNISSNIRYTGGQITIPRHLRDIYITEYGIADLLGKTDADCIKAMLAITDVRFQDEILTQAQTYKKLPQDYAVAETQLHNTPTMLAEKLHCYRADGSLPDYPLGSDFTPVEQRVVKALTWLKQHTDTKADLVKTLAMLAVDELKNNVDDTDDLQALARMQLDDTEGYKEKLTAKLLSFALSQV